MIERIKRYAKLMRLDKPMPLFLLLWPTLWAIWLASGGYPAPSMVIIFILGVMVTRSAGCVINDLLDRNLDCHVHRTRQRPLASKQVSIKESLLLFLGLLCCALLLVLFLNTLAITLAFAGVILMIIYPLLKRLTHLPQLGLGVAFSWGIPLAYAAECDAFPLPGGLLFFAAFLWPIIYDTFYAMVDKEDDLKVGIKSTAILFGAYDQWIIAGLQIIFLFLMMGVGFLYQLNVFYFLSLLIAGLLFCYQQFLIREKIPDNYFSAFYNNHWVGCVIFIGIVLGGISCCSMILH